MPTTPSAAKRMRQNAKRRLRNASLKSKLRTARRKLLQAIEQKQGSEATAMLKTVSSLYDKGVKKGIIKLNNAARSKSRLAVRVNALFRAQPAPPPSS